MKALRIKDFPDYYITDTGDVYSWNLSKNPNGRIKRLKPLHSKDGYYRIDFMKEKNTTQSQFIGLWLRLLYQILKTREL